MEARVLKADELINALSAPFPPAKISWRIGSTTQDKAKGMALAYIDSRDVMDRFNAVCGGFGWQCNHTVAPDGKKVTCSIGVKNPEDGAWAWRSDGAGETDIEGEKGSYSDSLKRAAVSFGVGRYLYDLDSPWVALEAAGKSFKIAAHEFPRLEKLLSGHKMPAISRAEKGDALDKARSWANDAIRAINGFSADELAVWEKTRANINGLVELRKMDQDTWQQVVDAIKKASE